MGPTIAKWAAALLGLLAIVSPALSRADDLEAAKRFFDQAEKQYAAKEYRGALDLYQKAFEAKPLPGFHFNIGQCHRALGEHEQAIVAFRRYLNESGKTPKYADKARQLISLSEADLAKKAPQPAPPVMVERDEKPPPPVEPPPPPPPSRRRLRPVYFWSGVALTGALLLTGTITGAVTIQKGNQYNDPKTPYGDLQGLRDSGQTLKNTSTALFALGAGAAVATTVLYFFTDFRKSGEGQAVGAVPIEGGAMLSWTGEL
jgi:tetratricopeptide (TPR) repeat protein